MGPISTGEAAHPSMGTWGSKYLVLLSWVVVVELKILRPFSWTILLWVTTPVPGGFVCIRLNRLSDAPASPVLAAIAIFRMTAVGLCVCVCLYVCVCVCVCVCLRNISVSVSVMLCGPIVTCMVSWCSHHMQQCQELSYICLNNIRE